MNKTAERNFLQSMINSGSIADAHELLAYVDERGWTIKRTNKLSKEGRRMVGVRIASGNVFRVEFGFDHEALKPKRSPRKSLQFFPGEIIQSENGELGYWIYGLIAGNHEKKACYIGQTTRCLRRFKDHQKRSRVGKGSYGLFEWADRYDLPIRAVILDYVPNLAGKSATAQKATILEGTWLMLAIEAGYETPLIENWGQLPTDRTAIDHPWPDKDVESRAIPVDAAIEGTPDIFSFCLPYLIERLAPMTRDLR